MLARSSMIIHPSGCRFQTPLLVPSFSSKGFRVKKNGVSEVSEALETTLEVLTESMLVSAYDIHYGRIPKRFRSVPEIVIVDSGGYEISDDHDLSAVFRHTGPVKPWTETLLRRTLDSWPTRFPAIFVNYDHPGSRRTVLHQIQSASDFFERYPGQLNAFLIKPEKKKELTFQTTVSSIEKNIERLSGFDIIGVTEKEIGTSLLQRMQNIAKIRLALDKANIRSPIQVFGSLDPLGSCLYFLAGAEIFDGLTWLRYSYRDGNAIYYYNYGALQIGIHETDGLILAKALVDNIYYLRKLQYRMKDFLLEGNFDKFEFHSELLKGAYDTLCTSLGGRI